MSISADQQQPLRKLLTWDELAQHGVVLSRRQVDRLEAAGKFPKRVPVSEGRVAWITDEIVAHVEARIARRSLDAGKLGSQTSTEDAA